MGVDKRYRGGHALTLKKKSELAENLSSLKAGGTNILTLGSPSNQGTDALNIWIPTTAGLAHGVRDVVTKTRAFATDVAV